ncbi:4Fe-4S dicluster domain-containing protein [Desulfofundulus sp. TPOSR]|jgi:heterodisulfide reductase subunit C|uniref:Heterodisulfide reductase subunit C-like protein n=1 Tax=Desulfofundulus kuznetsovii (strain DSM 6115 / VKM B-1805 / 17) TaxID=760568 RepID=A0AAU8PVF9_DESK7|nr:4Fe-4S dicluster domain-containing protein [Desulfofundulus sp. TPOSR]AEG15084.1 heterodisulfide reductase subunit C-like protein [Desulfofundulus kuznetsovii DSM 6115]NHM28409.1 4Fe-4S dicluster domain-containing protein [Desulfofundulus sp. TPOSR]
MAMDLSSKISRDLIERIKEISGQNANLCMQCGTCSASCTGREVMDFPPRQVMRMIQLGNTKALNLKSIWVCSTCLICTARCPRGIDIARLMEALRVINLRQGREVLVAEKIPLELLTEVPQMALTSGFRKLSA